MGLSLLLAACANTAQPRWAPDDEVAQATYRHPAPPSISLMTVVNNKSGLGSHAALMINGGQRVIFDPAGTWWHPQIPERNDVHYGFTPRVEAFYLDYHTRASFDTVIQTVPVSPEVAAHVMQLVEGYGAVPKAQCTKAITAILAQTPGFEDTPQTWYPRHAMAHFGAKPGVRSQRITDDDANDNRRLLEEQQGG